MTASLACGLSHPMCALQCAGFCTTSAQTGNAGRSSVFTKPHSREAICAEWILLEGRMEGIYIAVMQTVQSQH